MVPKVRQHERRHGESVLSDFADYVEQQQKFRYPRASHNTSAPIEEDHHTELDILESLNLADDSCRVRLKELLLDKEKDSLTKLTALLESRIEEGHGETLFEIGFENNSESMSLSKDEWDVAVRNLTEAAKNINAGCQTLLTKNVGAEQGTESVTTSKDNDCRGKFMIRRHPANTEDVIEIRIAVVGNVDAGKSTLLGVLVKGHLDDGRGKARVNLFRHKHEIESGRTSSVGMEIMGFDSLGQVVAAENAGRKLTWQEIGKRSAKVVSFSDLAGHERYLRTTVFGMLSSNPNFCLFTVAANNGLVGMSKEHLGIALALNVPVMVVITKIDISPPQILEQTIQQILRILKSPGARKIPVFIKNMEECVNTATQFVSQRICPIFQVSNVTGESLDLVRAFLNLLPHHGNFDAEAPFEFNINDTFTVPFVGTVVAGILRSGVVHTGDTVLYGPDSLGQFSTTKIRSIERKRIPVQAAFAGQSVSFALKKVRRMDVRKGMVILPKTEFDLPKAYREFVAEVLILSHATTIKVKYQAMLHVGSISQTCAIIDIDRSYIRTGDRALVVFRFIQRPEYIAPGDKLLFREGKTKGLGIIKSVGYDPDMPLGVATADAECDNDGMRGLDGSS